jgi:hypothetical protein
MQQTRSFDTQVRIAGGEHYRRSCFSAIGDDWISAAEFDDLLRSTVKAVARQSLSEPQLVADLKDC